MPTTYTHWKFGTEIYGRLPDSIRRDVDRSPELYAIGQHGPDIFFYYNAVTKNPVNRLGNAMHSQPAAAFLEPAAERLRWLPADHGHRAWVYGFICHFMLDSCVHWYVEDKIAAGGVSHSEIEAEFDRILMVRDGLDPVSFQPVGHIVPSAENALVIAGFFPELSVLQVQKSLQDMVRYLKLLVCPGKAKRAFLTNGIRILGLGQSIGDMIINLEPDPRCADSNAELTRLFNLALDETVEILVEFEAAVRNGTPLPSRFSRTFGPDKESKEQYEEKHEADPA